MLTKAQIGMYWREWSKVRKKNPDADRHAIQDAAIGEHKSHRDIDPLEEFDKVLSAFAAISDPANLLKQMRLQNQDRQRLIWVIQHRLNPPEAYLRKICTDKFRCTSLDLLNVTQLRQLRFTLNARRNAFRHGPIEPEPATSNCPF